MDEISTALDKHKEKQDEQIEQLKEESRVLTELIAESANEIVYLSKINFLVAQERDIRKNRKLNKNTNLIKEGIEK